MNTDDVVIPINSTWVYRIGPVPQSTYRVVELGVFHAGPDTWVPAVVYRKVLLFGRLDVERFIRTQTEFLDAFRPA